MLYTNLKESYLFCPICGKQGLNVYRKKSKEREIFHRKKMFCFFCQTEVNMIECKTPDQIEEFKANYAAGVYAEEAQRSIEYIKKETLPFDKTT